MRRALLVFVSLTLFLLLSPALFAQSGLVEDTEVISDAQSRWLLSSLTVHPRLWRDPADATTVFLKFTMQVQYQGPDYDFSGLSANNVASLGCNFGLNTQTMNAAHYDQAEFVYADTLPLVDNQKITADIFVKLPAKYKKLLTRSNNFCFVQLNNVIDGIDLTDAERDVIVDGVIRDSAPFDYKLKMTKNTLRLAPR